MAEAPNKKSASEKQDDDLTAMFNDALKGFKCYSKVKDSTEKSQQQPSSSAKKSPAEVQNAGAAAAAAVPSSSTPDSKVWEKEFSKSQVDAAEAESHENFLRQLQEKDVFQPEDGDESREALEKALKKMLSDLENIGAQDGGAVACDDEEVADLDKYMCQMLESAIYNDIFLPIFEEQKSKLRKYLKSNAATLPKSTVERHSAQLKHIESICVALQSLKEKKEDRNSEAGEKVLQLLMQIQSNGPLPDEVLAAVDGQGIPQLPSNFNGNECCLM